MGGGDIMGMLGGSGGGEMMSMIPQLMQMANFGGGYGRRHHRRRNSLRIFHSQNRHRSPGSVPRHAACG